MDIDYEMRKIDFEISQKRRGMSQKELAEKANITQQQISKNEVENCYQVRYYIISVRKTIYR